MLYPPSPPLPIHTFIRSHSFSGDALLMAIFKDMPDVQNHLTAFWKQLYQQDLTESTNYWKVVEAFNQVPTLPGLPLNWTTNAYVIHKHDLQTSGDSSSKTRTYDLTLR